MDQCISLRNKAHANDQYRECAKDAKGANDAKDAKGVKRVQQR